ncbi:TOBE domain-containing protein [Paraburkholderia lycopersici]|uniref:Molybdate transport system regulatory protein n=1 Tax=Paraburkholderia lycopersici TaxID=416944 RepID=A0A1G6P5G4_9BURK|nr:TOBE domain-containing protein [Paraburkholderia lycopersici]SDC74677.1 molybdate transport system regulatory protein [Paraburkholderia lycopersici]
MKTTARNQLAGTIDSVTSGPVTTQVSVTLPGDHQVVATITTAAAERLNVQRGKKAILLVKASAVVLVTDFDGCSLSARNQFRGTISRLERGAVSSLVELTLPGDTKLVSTATNDAADALSLSVGMAATAVFKAYSVMVAVAT